MVGSVGGISVNNGNAIEPTEEQEIDILNSRPNAIGLINVDANPEGVVTAPKGSLASDRANGVLYYKASGAGNTGWSAVNGGATSSIPIGALEYFSNANGDSYLGSDWLKCDGSILDQADYPTLYARMGLINGGGTIWQIQTSGTSSNLIEVDYLNEFVAVGASGTVLTSTDGTTWSGQAAVGVTPFTDITHSPSIYLISNQIGGLYTSTNGLTWTSRVSGTDQPINSVMYGNSTFVYAGAAGAIATSTDAITWTTHISPTASILNCGTFGNSTFVVGAANGKILTSTDGIVWSTRDPSIGQTSNGVMQPLTSGVGIYVGVSGNGIINTSTNGIDWTVRTSGTTSSIAAVTFGTVFIAGGVGGVLLSSTDGITWTSRTSGTTSSISALTFGSLYVYGGAGGVLRTSTDGITWDARTSGTTSAINWLIYDVLYVLAGGGGLLKTSTDAITWDARTSGTTSIIRTLTSGGGVYVYGGISGALGSSTDAITWTARSSQTTSTITSLIYAGGKYVYCAGTTGVNVIGTSTDAITWTITKVFSVSGAQGTLTYFGGAYYLYSVNGGSYTSTDAISWSFIPGSGTVSSITFLRYINDQFYFSSGTYLASSTDAKVFTQNVTITSTASSGDYSNGVYTLCGSGGITYTSTDGSSWNLTPNPCSSAITGMVAANNKFVGVGASGAIVSASNTYSYDPLTQFQLPLDADLNGQLTYQYPSNYKRSLYVKAA